MAHILRDILRGDINPFYALVVFIKKLNMKIPKTTEQEPYIEFRFSSNGKLTLSASSNWWGGINSGFISSGGAGGNSCLPRDLEKFIERYKSRQLKEIDDEIKKLLKKKEQMIKKFNL